MGESTANGRNQLLRNCNCCGSTDKALNRQTEPPKKKHKSLDPAQDDTNNTVLSPDEAKALKKKVADMEPVERMEWYRSERTKREAEDKTARRTFERPKGFVKDITIKGQNRDADHDYENFEDWAVRQIIFKRCLDEEGAKPLWKLALAASDAKVIEENKFLLLGRFRGVRVSDRVSNFEPSGMESQPWKVRTYLVYGSQHVLTAPRPHKSICPCVAICINSNV
jgi:hypothetical protein